MPGWELFSGHPVNLQNSTCNLSIFSACITPQISLPYSATGWTIMSKRWHIKDGFCWLFPLVIGSVCYLWWPHGLRFLAIHKLLTLLKHWATVSIYWMKYTQFPRDFHQHSIWSPWKTPCNTAFIRPQSLVPSLHMEGRHWGHWTQRSNTVLQIFCITL